MNLFENLKYDLKSIRLGQSVKPVYLSKLPKDLNKIKSTQKKKNTFIKIIMPLILDENSKTKKIKIIDFIRFKVGEGI